MVSNYPVQFDVDFPSRPLDRLTTAFRLLAAIPIVVVLTMLTGEMFRDDDTTNTVVIGGAAVDQPGERVCVHAGDRSIPAVPVELKTWPSPSPP